MSADTSRRDTIEKVFDADRWRSEQPYDGVLGALPQWLPANFHAEFETTRNKLLRDGYTPDDIRRFMVEIAEIERSALASPDDPPELNPETPFDIYDAVSTLARLYEGVRLGEKQGLAYLTDAVHAAQVIHGKKQAANLAAGPQVASEKRKVKAAEKHAVIDEAVCSLLKHSDSARWTNDEIVQFLIDRKLSTLKFGPTKNIVRRIAARERAKFRRP